MQDRGGIDGTDTPSQIVRRVSEKYEQNGLSIQQKLSLNSLREIRRKNYNHVYIKV